MPTQTPRDAGSTLAEMLVALGVLAVLLTVVSGSLVDFARDLRRTQGAADATEQGRRVFSRLDRQLRPASAVNAPVRVGSDWYLEFLTSATGADATGQPKPPRCAQWRILAGSGEVQSRVWDDVPSPTVPVIWRTEATGAVVGTEAPFVLRPADGTHAMQSVELRLTTRSRSNPPATAQTVTRLAARNTTTDTPTNTGSPSGDVCRRGGTGPRP